MDIDLIPYTAPGQTGVILGEPNEVYHENPALSNSQVFDLHKDRKDRFGSTLLWKEKHIDHLVPKEQKPQFSIGSAVHTGLLEGPEALAQEFVVLDMELSFTGKANKLASVQALNSVLVDPVGDQDMLASLAEGKKDDIMAFFNERPSRPVLTSSESELVSILVDRLRANHDVQDLLSGGHPEVTFRTDEHIELGYPLQCRTDWWNPGGCELSHRQPYAWDLKTIENLSLVGRHYADWGYYRTFPFYQQVTRGVIGEVAFEDFFFVFVEKNPPYEIIVRKPDRDSYETGLHEVVDDLTLITDCLQSGRWPGATSIGTLTLPPWHRSK